MSEIFEDIRNQQLADLADERQRQEQRARDFQFDLDRHADAKPGDYSGDATDPALNLAIEQGISYGEAVDRVDKE